MCYRFDLLKGDKNKVDLVSGFTIYLTKDLIVNLRNEAYYIYLKDVLMLDKSLFGLKIEDKIIYNARSETVLEKDLFKGDYLINKLVVPCSCFYEKDNYKEEHKFTFVSDSISYLAGFKVNNNIILLTKKASDDLDIFTRLPICLTKSEVEKYLKSYDDISILKKFDNQKFHITNYSSKIKLF